MRTLEALNLPKEDSLETRDDSVHNAGEHTFGLGNYIECTPWKTGNNADEQMTPRDDENGDGLTVEFGSFYIPKRRCSNPQGDDAHFICAEEQTFGVADGVGACSKHGVDPGKYARNLMTNCAIAVQSQPRGSVDPKWVLTEGHSKTELEGSSTACIVTLTDNHYLHAANLGDSGFMLIREGKVIYKSPVQQHSFNCPYQLSYDKRSDMPSAAKEIEVAVAPGDIIVAGTDGLLDNLYPSDIADMVTRKIQQGARPPHIAWTIAKMAFINALDKYYYSPFSKAAKRAGHRYRGGKRDDITVVVATIR
ncbi:hypothetical protein Ancab_031090 [Ancistrocladus abbreviatus]